MPLIAGFILSGLFRLIMDFQPKFRCDLCDYSTSKKYNWTDHINTVKHKRLYLPRNHERKPAVTFECSLCSIECSHLSILNRHKNTKLHKKAAENAGNDNSLIKENHDLRNFIIEQSKVYTENMNKILAQNADIMNKVIECCKTTTQTTINQTNNNNQTNKFNINVFLSEQCKDAINFSDFIKSIEVTREDLENNARLGFVDGVSKILIEHLKLLNQTERPIHCTDIKRETMYIKDEDKWTREEDSTKFNKAIQEVTRKSMISLLDWKEENPDYKDRDSAFSDRCIVIQQQSMAAHNRDTYFPKVARAVAKEVMVDK